MSVKTMGEVVQECLARFRSGEPRPEDLAYRRGYNHGYEEAIRHVRLGLSLGQMGDHGDRIEHWREQGWRTGVDTPPVLERGA